MKDMLIRIDLDVNPVFVTYSEDEYWSEVMPYYVPNTFALSEENGKVVGVAIEGYLPVCREIVGKFGREFHYVDEKQHVRIGLLH